MFVNKGEIIKYVDTLIERQPNITDRGRVYNDGFKDGVEFALKNCSKPNITCRFLFFFKDGEHTSLVYVESENQEKAEQKVYDHGWIGWIRVVNLAYDMQTVYNGIKTEISKKDEQNTSVSIPC